MQSVTVLKSPEIRTAVEQKTRSLQLQLADLQACVADLDCARAYFEQLAMKQADKIVELTKFLEKCWLGNKKLVAGKRRSKKKRLGKYFVQQRG